MPEVKTIQLQKSAGTCPRCLNKKVINPHWSTGINAAGRQEICLTTYCPACKVHIHQNLFIDGGTQVVWEAPKPNRKTKPSTPLLPTQTLFDDNDDNPVEYNPE